MKKGILVCAAVVLLFSVGAAPAAAASRFGFGLKAGFSLANNVWSDDDGMEKSLIRPTFGVFALIKLSPMLAVQSELNYRTMGEWWDDDGDKIVETFNYLHIPVLIRARLMSEGTFVPVVFAGPVVGFLLSAKEAGYDIKDFFKTTDFGVDLGLGAEIGTGKVKGLLDLRYYLGLTNAYSRPPIILTMALPPTDFSMKNRGFVFTAGLIF